MHIELYAGFLRQLHEKIDGGAVSGVPAAGDVGDVEVTRAALEQNAKGCFWYLFELHFGL